MKKLASLAMGLMLSMSVMANTAYEQGVYYYNLGTDDGYRQAFTYFSQAAEQGDSEAQYRLGDMLFNGDFVPMNHKEAFLWYLKAAEQNHPKAQFKVGFYYYNGIEMPKDLAAAYEWYRLSALQGYDIAQHQFGDFYFFGVYVEQDIRKGLYWYEKSVEADEENNGSLQYFISIQYSALGENQKSLYWLSKAARNNYQDAILLLAYQYYHGIGIVLKNYHKAFELYGQASELGNSEAMHNIGTMYYNGFGVRQNFLQAKEWFGKACDNGNQNGCDKFREIKLHGYLNNPAEITLWDHH